MFGVQETGPIRSKNVSWKFYFNRLYKIADLTIQ